MRALTFFSAGFVYFASWDYFISTYAPHLPHMGTCAGEPYAAVAGDVILSSYLVLFISFYIATYKKAERGKASMKAAAKKAEIEQEREGVTAVKEPTGRAKRGAKSANKARHRLGSSRQSFS
jgi:fatty acid elongase 3